MHNEQFEEKSEKTLLTNILFEVRLIKLVVFIFFAYKIYKLIF